MTHKWQVELFCRVNSGRAAYSIDRLIGIVDMIK